MMSKYSIPITFHYQLVWVGPAATREAHSGLEIVGHPTLVIPDYVAIPTDRCKLLHGPAISSIPVKLIEVQLALLTVLAE